MTDKEYEKQKARVKKVLNRWLTVGFNWWNIELEWNREKDEDSPSQAAQTHTMWQYRDVNIIWNLPVIKNQTDEELETIVVHELSHILIASIQDFSNDDKREMTEFATTNVARALQWAAELKKP